MYVFHLGISGALCLGVFEQSAKRVFFGTQICYLSALGLIGVNPWSFSSPFVESAETGQRLSNAARAEA
jgi:hypothetical protein